MRLPRRPASACAFWRYDRMMSHTLGAIIAGGKSTRFGSDKAMADVGGRPMLEVVVQALDAQVDSLVICGRDWPSATCLEDAPAANLGPLGGLNAALRFAADEGFERVLSMPVDVLPLPLDLVASLANGAPAVLREQHLIGLWPVKLVDALGAYLADGGRRVSDWIMRAGAVQVELELALHNFNYRDDLDAFLQQRKY